MNITELQEIVKKILNQMECTNISFEKKDEKKISVTFNCKNLTSFKSLLNGWIYSGIYINPTDSNQYKIDFFKVN